MEIDKIIAFSAGKNKGSIQFDYIKEANYAMARNNCRLLLACVIANDSDAPWHNVEIAIDGEALGRSFITIDTLAPGARADATKDVSIDIDAAKMGGISESIDSTFTLAVSIDGERAFEKEYPLALMPFDQWLGLGIRPDLTAAFVTPNHPILSRVAVAASKILEKWTGSGMLDEYQSQDPNRARQQVAAIYEALRAEGLIYATPPASFERTGQRIRLVDKVLNEKLGTCIDLTLLMASCLEAIGINPIIIFTKGHCFAGAWLVRDTCGKPVNDDPDFLLKSSADGINEIVAFETTSITSSSPVPFEDAVAIAQTKLRSEAEFECFVDVAHCRICGVKPLPARVRKGDEWVIENEGADREEATTKVRKFDRYDLGEYDRESAGITKYTIWERKLLDFSLRNNLLNMRLGKRIIPLVSFSIDKLEDCLQAGQTFQVLPFPLDSRALPNDMGIYDSAFYPQLEQLIIDDAAHRKVRSFLGDNDLKDALKYVYRASRTSLEENGANNLYIVFGLLKWYESDRSRQAHFAPILLLPINIVRKGGLAGYEIRTRDEEMMLNVTLAELLKQQHGIDLKVLEDLPKDEAGVDVKRIFAIIRDKIKSKKGWNVFDESLIGLFSFNKFVMWHDIHTNSDKLHSNEIISSLVEGKLNINNLAEDIDAKDADANSIPSQFAIPIDVDSSQLEAIIASGDGRSFILHGPPGTGKSQTITNMIANALYHGKRVLFVAEKMAALEVVQSRLEKIGLAPFCLELHSNKVTKQHFLSQMEAALEVARKTAAVSYADEAEALYARRKELIGIISAVHSKNNSGLSLYDCINSFMAIDGDEMDIDINRYADYSMRDVENACEKIRAIDAVIKVTGNPGANPLVGLDLLDGSVEAEDLLRKEMPRFASLSAKWTAGKQALEGELNITLPDGRDAAQWMLSLAEALETEPRLNKDLIAASLDAGLASSVRASIEAGRLAEAESQKLSGEYSKDILRLSSREIDGEWRQIMSNWFLPKFLGKRSFLKRMSAYKPGFVPEDVDRVVASLRIIEDNNAKHAVRANEIGRMFATGTSWADMIAALDRLPALRQIIDNGASLASISAEAMAERLTRGFGEEKIASLRATGKVGIEASDTLDAIFRVAVPQDKLQKWPALADAFMQWHKHLDAFRQRFLWCRQARDLKHDRLGCVADYVMANGKSGEEAAKAFAKSFFHLMSSRIINADERLRYFNGILFEDTIEKYRQAAARFQALSKEELYCRLASNIPSITMAAHENSEIGILKRNIKNGGRGTSIRKLIDSIPTLLHKLCPCMLMSPISVAQYISLDSEKFDLVIFDEASQMPTSEAVGAIARGKALVVVGDPKQMPPTSFFSTSAVGEDEAAIDDMESILDDCISLSIPSKHLSWHYRSRHESLIAFSNAQYYDGRLTTFPSTDDQVTKVTLHPVQGVYDKGRSRSNQAEAQAIVDEVVRRLSDPELSKMSIGIVSFSKVQQDKIEDLLTDTLAKHPDLEALAYESSEPIFIKNLENVQGDERDVILFSVGYGPDANGKVSMNFGPLNNAGGERRLNVAASRARCEMVVFASLKSADIDLRRSDALGVEGLKKFLEYAESGRTETPASQTLHDSADCIAKQVAEMLRSHGYVTKLNVGRSQFRVDVAVANPNAPSEFMLGILCDGPAYYATKTVRDREIVQQEVLKRLNWNIMRVWTLDWFERRADVEKSILDTLAKISAGKAAEEKQENAEESNENEPVAMALAPAEPTPLLEEAQPFEEYTFAEIDQTPVAIDDINTCRPQIKSMLQSLVATEAPITNGLICKRVVKALGLTRVSPRIQAIVDELIRRIDVYSEINGATGGTVYWRTAGQASDFKIFRTNSAREIADIPLVEIANAMRYVIDQQIAIDKESLKRLTSNMLGFTRMGTNISQAVEAAFGMLLSQGYVSLNADKVSKI